MEYIARRRVVNDDDLLQVTAQFVQIFNVVPTMIDARFAEQTRSEYVPAGKIEYVIFFK